MGQYHVTHDRLVNYMCAIATRNFAAVLVNTVGNARVINIADNPNFRAFWLGGTKLFMNAISFEE